MLEPEPFLECPGVVEDRALSTERDFSSASSILQRQPKTEFKNKTNLKKEKYNLAAFAHLIMTFVKGVKVEGSLNNVHLVIRSAAC